MKLSLFVDSIGGNNFNTSVNASDHVHIAIDFGNGSVNLPQGNSLTNSTRGVLNTSILSVLTETQEVRISSSRGNFDVTTTNTTIITKVKVTQLYIQGQLTM